MAKNLIKNKLRNNRGVSVILLVLVLAMSLLTIDFFVFNLAQILMIQRQISGVCEAASLAGTSSLSKFDIADDDAKHSKLSAAQKAAYRCAQNMILKNHILNHNLTDAIGLPELADLGKNLQGNACQYVIKLADPENNYSPVEIGNPKGKTLSCYISYGYRPIVLGFLKNYCYPVLGNAVGGLPQIDSVIALDLSCSMDDQTIVTFVRREWIHDNLGTGPSFAMGGVDNSTADAGIIQYVSLNCPVAPHTIANYLGWDNDIAISGHADGCEVNALPPQNLDKASNDPHGAITHPMYFDAYLRSHYPHYDNKNHYLLWEAASSPYSRAVDFATPPGNCDLSVGLGGNGDAMTTLGGVMTTGTQCCPQLNAFNDTTWREDDGHTFGYQPAAPGATHGLAQNDPIPSPDQQTFTDLVVNITPPHEQPMQGPDNFVGFSYKFPSDDPDPLLRNQTFEFLNIAIVVEAARGNLENSPVLQRGLINSQMALLDRPISVDGNIFDMRSFAFKDGYQRAYQRLAMLCIQPLASVVAAIDKSYLEKLHKLTDSHFGLVTFSSKGTFKGRGGPEHFRTFGTLNDSSFEPNNLASYYIFAPPYGELLYTNPVYDCGISTNSGLNDDEITDGSGFGFRMPRVPLAANDEHYVECTSKNKLKDSELNNRLNSGVGSNGLYNCRVQSLCDTAEALGTAIEMFNSSNYNLSSNAKNRIPARRLVILFIDGEPTGGITSNEAQETLKLANSANNSGIAVFTIGLNLTRGAACYKLKEHQAAFLGNKPTLNGGIALRAGHSSKYYPCESLYDIKLAFSDISRRFVQTQR